MTQQKPKNQKPYNRQAERGSVIIWIFVMAGLFALVSFAMMQGTRGTGAAMISERAKLLAAQVIDYGRAMRDAVTALKVKGCRDGQISFEQTIDALYTNAGAPSDSSCDVFDAAGAGLTFQNPDQDWLNRADSAKAGYGRMIVTARNIVHGAGTDCTVGQTTCSELVLIIPYIKADICRQINLALEITNDSQAAPPMDAGQLSATRFDGTFIYDEILRDAPPAGDDSLLGRQSGCIQVSNRIEDMDGAGGDLDPATGTYHYFHILLSR